MDIQAIQEILNAVIKLIFLVVTLVVIPYLKKKKDFDKLKEYINIGVRCAEMYFDTDEGKKKKEYVTIYVKNILATILKIEITDDMLDRMIESAVYNIKYESNNTATK